MGGDDLGAAAHLYVRVHLYPLLCAGARLPGRRPGLRELRAGAVRVPDGAGRPVLHCREHRRPRRVVRGHQPPRGVPAENHGGQQPGQVRGGLQLGGDHRVPGGAAHPRHRPAHRQRPELQRRRGRPAARGRALGLRQDVATAHGQRALAARLRLRGDTACGQAPLRPPEAVHAAGEPAGAALLPGQRQACRRPRTSRRHGEGEPRALPRPLPRPGREAGLAPDPLRGGAAAPRLRAAPHERAALRRARRGHQRTGRRHRAPALRAAHREGDLLHQRWPPALAGGVPQERPRAARPWCLAARACKKLRLRRHCHM
mmetsp:Transcript_16341/g.46650  ORF Transcript_16341/g.46650 Transcript_16341/m.46650 type:complete len:315 (-) Transcript_16341:85-1029(-)